jgi:hypothetical protein
MVIVNVGHIPGQEALEKVVSATLRAVFPAVMRDPVSAGNTLVLASTSPLSAQAITAPGMPAALGKLASTVEARLEPALANGPVYTDDVAPVEWLTDLAILRYAAGQR